MEEEERRSKVSEDNRREAAAAAVLHSGRAVSSRAPASARKAAARRQEDPLQEVWTRLVQEERQLRKRRKQRGAEEPAPFNASLAPGPPECYVPRHNNGFGLELRVPILEEAVSRMVAQEPPQQQGAGLWLPSAAALGAGTAFSSEPGPRDSGQDSPVAASLGLPPVPLGFATRPRTKQAVLAARAALAAAAAALQLEEQEHGSPELPRAGSAAEEGQELAGLSRPVDGADDVPASLLEHLDEGGAAGADPTASSMPVPTSERDLDAPEESRPGALRNTQEKPVSKLIRHRPLRVRAAARRAPEGGWGGMLPSERKRLVSAALGGGDATAPAEVPEEAPGGGEDGGAIVVDLVADEDESASPSLPERRWGWGAMSRKKRKDLFSRAMADGPEAWKAVARRKRPALRGAAPEGSIAEASSAPGTPFHLLQ